MTDSQAVWQVEVKGHVYSAKIEELIEWINEGSVLPEDKVRKGNLRWIKAEKVPELYGYFNRNNFANGSNVTTTFTDASSTANEFPSKASELVNAQNFLPEKGKETESEQNSYNKDKILPNAAAKKVEIIDGTAVCSVHPDLEARYFCGTCLTLFCKTCPGSFGGTVKICIDCGGMCQIYNGEDSRVRSVGAINKPYPRSELEISAADSALKNFGFAKALSYPFKFKTSLIFGAVLFMLFTLGQSVASFGMTMYFPAIICFMLANTLLFGCLANTVDNFAQLKTDKNFMPGFEDFSAWDDVIQPGLLSLAVYFISFGLLFVLIFFAFSYVNESESKIEADKQKIISTVLPDVKADSNPPNQISQLNQISEKLTAEDTLQNGNLTTEKNIVELQTNATKQTTDLQKLKENIKQAVKARLDSRIEENEEVEDGSLSQTAATVMRLSLVLSVPIFLALLWGIFYFPAACAVAAYTKNLTAIVNPAIAFDTIRRLGWSYLRVISVFLVLAALAFGLNAILQTMLSSANLPVLGNLPAKAIVSLFVFYLSIVFSVTLGVTLAKAATRLSLSRS